MPKLLQQYSLLKCFTVFSSFLCLTRATSEIDWQQRRARAALLQGDSWFPVYLLVSLQYYILLMGSGSVIVSHVGSGLVLHMRSGTDSHT
jgi:hypothetical protein